jgi:MurNAc alpha-1-phosphate uridylyltransferase
LDKFPPVLILAGGRGTRLGSSNPGLPKSLVSVNGEPFIVHQLRLLHGQGIEDVVLCVGHLEKLLREFVGDGTKFGINVRYSSDGDQLLGTGGAVLKASKFTTSPFAVLYGDSYLDVPFAPFVESFRRSGNLALMTVYKNNNDEVPSNLLVKNGTVISYDKEKPTTEMEYIDYGLTIFASEAFAGFTAGQHFDLGAVVKQLITQGELVCHEVHARFHEVGTVEGLKALEEHLQNK